MQFNFRAGNKNLALKHRESAASCYSLSFKTLSYLDSLTILGYTVGTLRYNASACKKYFVSL